MVITLIEKIYSFLWGDLFQIPLPGGGSVGISLLIILLIPTGIYFTICTRFLPIRLFPEMVRSLNSKKGKEDGLSNFQTLIVSTATRVGMGNLVGVVAAISAGGAGAVFWMWITALIGSSTAFVEVNNLDTAFIKKKIRCMEDTAEVRHIISITTWKNIRERKRDIQCRSIVCNFRINLLVWY